MQLIQYLLIALVIYILWRSVVKPFMADSENAKEQRKILAQEEEKNRESMAAAERLASEMNRRSEEHTSELQSLMSISYAVFCLKKNMVTIYMPATVRHTMTH